MLGTLSVVLIKFKVKNTDTDGKICNLKELMLFSSVQRTEMSLKNPLRQLVARLKVFYEVLSLNRCRF